MTGKKSAQRWLRALMRDLCPGAEIIEDYRRHELYSGK